MSIGEITEVLKNNYPSYMSYEEICFHTGIGKQSVLRSLRRMVKREEIQMMVKQGHKLRAGWENFYRINGGHTNGK